MLKKLIVLAAFLVAVMLPATGHAWILNTVQDDSCSCDSFSVNGDDDIDTSETFSFSSAGLDDFHVQICAISDSIEFTVMVHQSIWPDTSWTAYRYEVVDSIVFTGLSAATCSLWTPVFDVPPHDFFFTVNSRVNNSDVIGTFVHMNYFREETLAD